MKYTESPSSNCVRSVAALVVAAVSFGTESTFAQSTELVSVATGGAQGNYDSPYGAISADGRFVAFYSNASNLVAGDTNGVADVFVRDRQSGTTERVSVATGGAQGNIGSNSYIVSISADGRFVAFGSLASNLVAGDTNSYSDVFVRDRQAGTTERVSVDSSGVEGNAPSGDTGATLSGDGRFVAFRSAATNLVVGDTNGKWDVFVRDRQGGTTERVSVNSAGVEGQDDSCAYSTFPSISADGRYVAFMSRVPHLVPGDTNGFVDSFVRDRQSGTTERVSLSSAGAEGNGNSGNSGVMISADGRFVAFESFASNLVAGDTNGFRDVFVRDRTNATTECVSVATGGAAANNTSGDFGVSIAGNGRFIAFTSYAWNLVAADTNGQWDVFVRDRQNATTGRMSVSSAGAQGSGDSGYTPSISSDGRWVAFSSTANNLVAGDIGGRDVFVHDREPPPLIYCTAGISSHGCSASIATSASPSISLSNPCNIAVVGVEGQKSGLLIYGIDNSSFAPAPWAVGSTSWVCVKPPTQRTPIQTSGGTIEACDGSLVLDWNAYQAANPYALGQPWIVGAKVYVQAWFRDPLAVKSTNLSNALEMTYVP